MLRFVVLVNCATLLADRARGFRQIATAVRNVLPDFGSRTESRTDALLKPLPFHCPHSNVKKIEDVCSLAVQSLPCDVLQLKLSCG